MIRPGPLRTALLAFIASRLVCGSFVYLGHIKRLREGYSPEGGWEGTANWWLNPWTTYDSEHFVRIAQHGYDVFRTPFFPLYPLLLRLGGSQEAGQVLVGVLLSNLCFLIALWLLGRLTRLELGKDASRGTVWLLAFFPTTAFFSAVYSESLFLLLLVGCFLAARTGHWKWAGLIGFLAALSRNPGFLLSLALLVDYSRSREPGKSTNTCDVLFLFLPLLGFLGVQAYFWASFDSALAGVTSQEYFYRQVGWPWNPVWNDLVEFLQTHRTVLISGIHLLFTLLAFALAWRWRNRLRRSYLLLILGIMLMHLTFHRIIYPQTIGSVRYLSTLFPFSQGLYLAWSEFAPLFRRVVLALYLYICCLFSYGFGLKGFFG